MTIQTKKQKQVIVKRGVNKALAAGKITTEQWAFLIEGIR